MTVLPQKVLIANRGEIAVRIARTCRSMGIATVAVHSDVDADASHVRACDEAVLVGAAAPAASYLRVDALLDAAARTGADAVHPGYGFLSENAVFARAVTDAGLTWIGPPPDVIAAMGDKLEAKRRMADAGVPLVPGAELPEGTDVASAGAAVGFPLMVKAAAGGGGKGMRVVHDPAELVDAVDAARREATGAFGDGTVFLERYLPDPRHVEVQILGDVHGTVVHAFERECSIQRRHQKVVEETPSPGIDDAVRRAICDAAVTAARALGYVNAGTVEFIADEGALARRRADEDVAPSDCFAFLEVNTRLQVEHPVTEEVVRVRDAATGVATPLDLVRLQLLVAAGEPLPFSQEDLVQDGHAIEVRLYAEDPANGYLPATGTLHAFAPAGGPGIRWDAGVAEGDVVSPHYDPMLAKVVAYAATRTEAAARLARTLDETVLLGSTTNRDLLVTILRARPFLDGATTTSYLDVHHPDDAARASSPDTTAVHAALVAAGVAELAATEVPTGLPKVRAGFTNTDAFSPEMAYDVDGAGTWRVTIRTHRDGTSAATLVPDDGPPVELGPVTWHPTPGASHLEVDGHRRKVRVVRRGDLVAVHTSAGRVTLRRHDRFPTAAGAEVAGATRAPMPGAVVTVAVAEGDAVEVGDLLCTVEAMKMEHRVTAPVAGTVTEVRVTAGTQVDADQVLVVVDAAADEAVAEG
ncbi:biotin/lipoyl-binding protein [Nitriliruptoraceae bacterium ZYF776]|nr:biotin/lipoyl-binding protein [Profundirhabdus halotolerans]